MSMCHTINAGVSHQSSDVGCYYQPELFLRSADLGLLSTTETEAISEIQEISRQMDTRRYGCDLSTFLGNVASFASGTTLMQASSWSFVQLRKERMASSGRKVICRVG